MKTVYTKEQWAAVEAYIANGMSYEKTAEICGMPKGTINSHVARKKAQEKLSQSVPKRKCPKCGTTIDSPKMKFCWNCGYDIRLEEILLIEDTKELRKILSILPSSQSDKGIQIALKIDDYIKREAKKKGCL